MKNDLHASQYKQKLQWQSWLQLSLRYSILEYDIILIILLKK